MTSFSGILFSFRSRYYCAIGFEEYLALEVDDPRLPARMPTRGTQDSARPPDPSRTGLSPSLVPRSRGLPLRSDVSHGGPTTPHLPCGIRFGLCRFRSPLLTTSRLISSPAPTKMFQFGAFPILTDLHRSARMSHWGISGSKAPCASPEHIAAWHALLRHSNRAIPWQVKLPLNR